MKEIKIVYMEQPFLKADKAAEGIRLMTVDVMYYEIDPRKEKLPSPKARRVQIWDGSDQLLREEEKQLWTKARAYYDEHLAQ
jgi:hypothetical protein